MIASPDTALGQTLDRIASEQRSDRTVRRLAAAGWVATGLVVLTLVAYVALNVRWILQQPAIPGQSLLPVYLSGLLPVVLAIGAFCALAATLATIGVLLRMRSASMHDIQLRLASLEELLTQSVPPRDQK